VLGGANRSHGGQLPPIYIQQSTRSTYDGPARTLRNPCRWYTCIYAYRRSTSILKLPGLWSGRLTPTSCLSLVAWNLLISRPRQPTKRGVGAMPGLHTYIYIYLQCTGRAMYICNQKLHTAHIQMMRGFRMEGFLPLNVEECMHPPFSY